jgi:hypothetical protein
MKIVLNLVFLSFQVFAQTQISQPARPLVQQCRIDLCGEGSISAEDEVQNYIRDHKKELHDKTRDLALAARAAFVAAARSERRYMEWLLKAVESDLVILDPYVRAFYAKVKNTAGLSEIVVREDGSLDVGHMRSLFQQRGFTLSQTEDRLKGLLEIVGAYNKLPLTLRDDFAYWSQKLNSTDLNREVLSAIDFVDAKRRHIAEQFQVPISVLFSDELNWNKVKKQILAGNLNSNLMAKLKDLAETAVLVDELVARRPLEELEKIPALRIREKVTTELESTLRTHLADLNDYLNGHPRVDNPYSKREDDIAHSCIYTAVRYDRYYPTTAQNAGLADNEKKWRRQYLEMIHERIPMSSVALIKNYFDGLLFKPPVTKDNAIQDMVQDLRAEKLVEESDFSIFSERARQLDLISELMDLEYPDPSNEVGSDVEDICTDAGRYAFPLKDHAIPASQRVHLGALSATEPHNARFVAFHEYSHILSYLLRKNDTNGSEGGKWRQDVGQCLIGFHDGSDQFEEEDFADLIGYDLNRGEKSVFCRFLSNQNDAWLTLINHDKTDKHSSELTRVLHSAAVNGNLPVSCIEALKAKGETVQIKRCLPD